MKDVSWVHKSYIKCNFLLSLDKNLVEMPLRMGLVQVKKKSILIVDDDKAVLKSIKEILQSEDYFVDTAETGREAIEKSGARFYNLALLDIKLPDIEGTALLTEMHKNTPRMMKVMVTGYPSLENAVEALHLGADAYVIKPVDPEELLKVLEYVWNRETELNRVIETCIASRKKRYGESAEAARKACEKAHRIKGGVFEELRERVYVLSDLHGLPENVAREICERRLQRESTMKKV